jgi:hypothetical protein
MGARTTLSELEVFTFEQALPVFESFIDSYRRPIPDADREGLLDLLSLTAAELEVLAAFRSTPGLPPMPLREAIEVSETSARRAQFETNCSIYTPVHYRRQRSEARELVPTDDRSRGLALWDLMLTAGDMSKARYVLERRDVPLEVPFDASGVLSLVTEMTDAYQRSEHPLARAVSGSGLLSLQGLIWSARLTVVVDDGAAPFAIDAAITEAAEMFGVARGRGMPG